MCRLFQFAVCCLFTSVCAPVFGQQYPFLPVPGSPKNVKVLFQDSRGRLWTGGDQIACFDGTRFFNLHDYGFPSVESYDITEDPSGAIWIGAETGVYRFSNGKVEEISRGVAISVIAATAGIAVAAVGPLGRGLPANASLIRIERTGDTWKTETVMNLESTGPLTLDHTGLILYPWPGYAWSELRLEDVIRWRAGTKLPVEHKGTVDLHAGLPAPTRVLRDRFGCLWIGTESGDIYNCGDGVWRYAPFKGIDLRSNLREAPDGSMVLTGYNTLAVGRPGSFRIARSQNGLPMLMCATQARDGTLWLGGAQGLYRFPSPFRMEYWTAREGVDNPWAIQRMGASIYGGLNRDVAVLSPDRQRWQSIASFAKFGQVMNLLPIGDSSLLVALNPGSAALVRRDGKILARAAPAYDGAYGLRLAKTPSREIWMGGISLGRLVPGSVPLKFENHRFDTQPAGNVLDVQYEDRTRKLWACYNGGLVARSEDGSWREITVKDGLLVNPCWSLAALPNGDVWYGYYNTPAFALVRPTPQGKFTVRQFRAGPEIADPESMTLDVDQRGWLWRGGNRGLSVAEPAEAESSKWLHLDQSDGLPGESMNTGSYFADTDGSIWAGIDISIFHYLPPADLVTPRFAPRIFVSALSWDNQPPRLADAVKSLPHGVKTIAHIGSLQFDRRNSLWLRYRILPGHPSWTETQNLDLALGVLSSGSHTLEVQGRIFTGPWSPILRRVFSVLTPSWLTWPFLAAYFLMVGSLAITSYMMLRRQAAEKAQMLPDLTAWRIGALLPDVHDVVGSVLDSRFEVGNLLARGGFASVMIGYDRALRKRCAVKIFRAEVRDKAWVQRSFEQEVAALQKVHHPNVVSIYAHGRTLSGAPYLVMEFIEGRSLREVIENGPLSPGRTARLLCQLAAALDAIHAQGICHRDVKPENVIVRDEARAGEEAMLIDFSIAIVKDANETLHGLSRAAGSFDYMAPEQAVGYAQPSSDIYSLAKVVIEMLTGRQLKALLPDAALDLPEQVRGLAKGLNLSFSEESIEILATALEFDPARRPVAASSFARPLARDMESFAAQQPL